MSISKRWLVRPSGFPFASPGQAFATVEAETHRLAEQLAKAVYGPKVVVEPESALTDKADPFPYRNPLLDRAAELVHAPTALRRMTSIEIQMARSVGVLRFAVQPKRYRGTIKRLHAETFKPAPQISEDLAKLLRAIVHGLEAELPRELIESVGAV